MRPNSKTVCCLSLLIALIAIYSCHEKSYDSYRCDTVRKHLKGIITRVYGHGSYAHIVVKGEDSEAVSFDIDDVIYKRKFDEFHYYAVGDSVFKNANSNIAVITNNDSICVVTLPCKEK